jgi:hypothetical protein
MGGDYNELSRMVEHESVQIMKGLSITQSEKLLDARGREPSESTLKPAAQVRYCAAQIWTPA